MANYSSSFANGAAVDAALHVVVTIENNRPVSGTKYLKNDLTFVEIKLDDLAAPDDNTDLDASITKHGLCPKGENTGGKALLDTLQWGYPAVDGGSP